MVQSLRQGLAHNQIGLGLEDFPVKIHRSQPVVQWLSTNHIREWPLGPLGARYPFFALNPKP